MCYILLIIDSIVHWWTCAINSIFLLIIAIIDDYHKDRINFYIIASSSKSLSHASDSPITSWAN